MNQHTNQKSRMSLVGRLILVGFGSLATYDALCHSPNETILPLPYAWLLFLGPSLLVVGCVILFRGSARGARMVSGRPLLIVGLVLLFIGVCPWLYGFFFGGDPEGTGFLGTITFIFCGLPGLVVLLVALVKKLIGK